MVGLYIINMEVQGSSVRNTLRQCPYLSGELMVAQTETPKKKSRKSIPENKKYKKRTKPDEEEQQ